MSLAAVQTTPLIAAIEQLSPQHRLLERKDWSGQGTQAF
jgi:hypothetical protein